MASCHPTIAVFRNKVGTVTSKAPTVMQRPQYALLSPFEPPKEKRQIEKPAMEIVQMNYIRVDFLQLPDKPERREE